MTTSRQTLGRSTARIAGIASRPSALSIAVGATVGAGTLAAIGVGAVSAVSAWRIVRPDRSSRPHRWTPAISPSDVESVAFTAPGGPSIHGWFMAPPTAGGPVVICLHGFSMNRHQFEHDMGWLQEAGYGSLAFDFRGHGESGGDFTTVGAPPEVADAEAAIAWVRTRLGAEVPVAVYGISMGGAVAIQVVGRDPTIRAVVTDCGFATLPRVLDHAFEAWMKLPPVIFRGPVSAWARLFTGLHVSEVRPIDHARAIAPRPYLLIHNVDDRWVDPNDADLIAQEYGPGIEMWRPPGDHVQARDAMEDEYRARILEFLARAVPVAPGP